jgi:hypothetical protein
MLLLAHCAAEKTKLIVCGHATPGFNELVPGTESRYPVRQSQSGLFEFNSTSVNGTLVDEDDQVQASREN